MRYLRLLWPTGAIIIGAGAIVAALVLISLTRTSAILDDNTRLLQANTEMQFHLLQAHTALKDRIRGEVGVDAERAIFGNIDQAALFCSAMRDGGMTPIGLVAPMQMPDDHADLARLCDEIGALRVAAADRLDARGPEQAGAHMAFDKLFDSIIEHSERDEAAVLRQIDAKRAGLRGVNVILLGVLAAIFGGMIAIIVRAERRMEQRSRALEQSLAEQQRAETALRASEERFQLIAQAAADALWDWDVQTDAIWWNPGFETLFGHNLAEIEVNQATYVDLIHSDDRDDLVASLDTAIQQGHTFWAREYRFRRADGTYADIADRGYIVRDEAGRAIRMVGAMVDIGARRQAEAELLRAKDAAEAMARAKAEFLANMSHEIRTPLNGVIGMTGLLLDTPLHGQQREYAETVRLSAESLLTIVNDILDFSKIEAGKLELEVTDFDLERLIGDAMSLFAERAQRKGLELASQIAPDVPTALRGDPFRILQVLSNLLANAIKFTERGEVVLQVDLAAPLNGRALVRFTVRDTGIGLTPEQQARLFQPFTQADASTTRKFGGSGLGLTIASQLVTLLGGTMGVSSEPGRGSGFWFSVPLAPQAGSEAPERGALQGVRVLIVDDNATNRRILEEQTARWGMAGRSVASGAQALEALHAAAARGVPFDLAILDMQMPEMDGLMLAHAIKADPQIAAVHLVLLTSMGLRGSDEAIRQAGIMSCLSKPARPSDLYNMLLTALMQAPAPAPAMDQPQAAPGAMTGTRENVERPRGRVLVVEDNAVNQRVAVGMLQARGYSADIASDGREGVVAALRAPYTAILMDCQMPELDGYEATAEIRRREGSARHTPIIAMTANALKGEREKCLAAGMDDYISKPVRAEELFAALERWSGASGIATEPESEPDLPDQDSTLDMERIDSLRKLEQSGAPNLLRRVVDLFLGDTQTRLAALRQSLAQDDAAGMLRTAHALKGSCANVGAQRMTAICDELEGLGREGSLAGAGELLARLEAEFDRARDALQAVEAVKR